MTSKSLAYTLGSLAVLALAATAAVTFALDGENLPIPEIPTGNMIADDAIYAPDQPPGTSINVPVVSLKNSYGWAVIRAVGEDGSASEIIGHSELIAPGNVIWTSAPLDRPSIDGEYLYVMLYADNGDQIFDSNDTPLRDSSGNVSTVMFKIDSLVGSVE